MDSPIHIVYSNDFEYFIRSNVIKLLDPLETICGVVTSNFLDSESVEKFPTEYLCDACVLLLFSQKGAQ